MESETRHAKIPTPQIVKVRITWPQVLVRILAAPLMTSLGLILYIGINYDPTGGAAYALVMMVFAIPLTISLGGNILAWVVIAREREALRLCALILSNLPLSLISFFWSLGSFNQYPHAFAFFFATPVITIWTMYLLLERK